VRQITQLTRQTGALTWSPCGKRLAYISGEWSDRGIIGGDVYTMRINGKVAVIYPASIYRVCTLRVHCRGALGV
jgi:hypothetical protein